VHVDAVLGLSMTPTSVGLVLVEGQDADGATMDGNAFDVHAGAVETSEQAAAAVRRTEALAATRGLRLTSIGVTWSEDADAEASMLMKSLSESGFDNVVPIRMPEATEALARGMAAVVGYETTAVCVIEPETVISLVVHASTGAVQTAFNHAIYSDDDLIGWLSTVFTKADWQPEALVVVGSAGGFASIVPALEDALSVPVFTPEEAQLALARGAALASAQSIDGPLDPGGEFAAYALTTGAGARQTRRGRVPMGAAGMLVAGVLTFVVSVSVAVSLELSPSRDAPASPAAAAADVPRAPAAARANPSVLAPPVAIPPAPAAPPVLAEAPPAPEAPPIDVAPAAAPDAAFVPEAPVVAEAPPLAPVYQEPPVAAPVIAPPPAVVTPPVTGTGPLVPNYTAPTKKPGILGRIRDKLRFGDDDQSQVAPAVPATPPYVPGQ
jgi:hypothetical protein